MKRYDREEVEDAPNVSGAFVQAEGDILYRWNDPNKRRLRSWQLAFVFLAVASIAAPLISFPQEKLIEAVSKANFELVKGVFSIALPILTLFLGFLFKLERRNKSTTEDGFQGIDLRAQNKELLRTSKKLRSEVELLKSRLADEPKAEPEKTKDQYEEYIINLIQTLDKHVTMAEEKASKLLDTGTMYLRRGIYFYITTIVIWQIAFHFWSGTNYIIYGIISCSLTFLVVEFLAAWFLKQYRSFTESSMQFMKVRSVFDRYLLAYYSLKEFGDENSKAETRALMLKVLEEKAGWPDTSALPADVNHMVQMFSSVSEVLEKIRPFKAIEPGKA